MQTARGASLSDDTGPAPARHAAASAHGRRNRCLAILAAVAVVVLAADVITKIVVVHNLAHRPPIVLIKGVLSLEYLRNPGAAFGLGQGFTVVLAIVALAVVITIVRTARRLGSVPWAIVLGLLLGGAAGNLGDRIFRSPGVLRGWVVDWIHLEHWPTFNIADSAIVIGACLAVLLAFRNHGIDGRRQDAVDADTRATESDESGA